MIKIVLGVFLAIYVTVLIVTYSYIQDTTDPNQATKTRLNQEREGFLTAVASQADMQDDEAPEHRPKPTKSHKSTNEISIKGANLLRLANPFFVLGAYSEPSKKYQEFKFDQSSHNIDNDKNYCDNVDLYNLAHPEAIFEEKNFYTDFPNNQLPNSLVMSKIGTIPRSSESAIDEDRVALSPSINSYFMQFSVMHHYHKIGSQFLCASQMYNHIPGVESLVTKDQVVDKINSYKKQYKAQPQCLSDKSLFLHTYRLYIEEECEAFFTKIHSREYKASLKEEAIQYVIKIGHGSHKSQGVFLLDKEETDYINNKYESGKLCGQVEDSLLAQTYIANPLLLDHNNKFDFRVYMLIASTNPLIVYYHDGFIKNSLYEYEKKSADRGTHITNTYLANQKIAEAKKKGQLIYGMNQTQLNEYILWDFEKLESYLLKSKRISDPNWLNNYLRPAFHKAFIHLTRMTKDTYWKGSNVYALQGADFMLDDKMNLWFIESNPSPLLSGTTKWKIYRSVVTDHFEVQFAYLRSRMKRAFKVVQRLTEETAKGGEVDYAQYREDFADAMRNRLEAEYEIPKTNTWVKVVDENLSGPQAYMNYLNPECL